MRTIIVTGSRDYTNENLLHMALKYTNADLILQGGASGADSIARNWAERNQTPCITYSADWKAYGRSAGPIRNAQMLDALLDIGREDSGEVDLRVLAFTNKPIAESRGTKNMCRLAYDAGVRVVLYSPEFPNTGVRDYHKPVVS